MAYSPTDSSTVLHRTMTSLSSLFGDKTWFKEHTSARLTVWVCDGSFFCANLPELKDTQCYSIAVICFPQVHVLEHLVRSW